MDKRELGVVGVIVGRVSTGDSEEYSEEDSERGPV